MFFGEDLGDVGDLNPDSISYKKDEDGNDGVLELRDEEGKEKKFDPEFICPAKCKREMELPDEKFGRQLRAEMGAVHRMLAGPCRKLCSILDPIADSLERLGGVLSWRDERLSTYVAVVLVALAFVLSATLRVLVVPARRFLDAHSPVRAWHVAWLVGVRAH